MDDRIARHLIAEDATVREALLQLDKLALDSVLFLTNSAGSMVGTVTDGDVRRYLLQGGEVGDEVLPVSHKAFKFLRHTKIDLAQLQEYREANFRIVPVLDEDDRIVDIINFRRQRSLLPLHAVIMAGGLGTRLRPLTDNTPKPLLKVGAKPILEYNIERLRLFGVRDITISVSYLGQQIVDYFGDGSRFGVSIDYLWEDEPRGTIGVLSEAKPFSQERVLVMNSDLLTTIDLELMFRMLLQQRADMIVATVPYEVKIPYGVVETDGELITALKEKPTYTYYSNAGIYIFDKRHVGKIPNQGRFGAPDLMEALYTTEHRVTHYPIRNYWLDIGKHADYEKAQTDVQYLKFD